jgi:hypothetical protein
MELKLYAASVPFLHCHLAIFGYRFGPPIVWECTYRVHLCLDKQAAFEGVFTPNIESLFST